MVSNRWAFAALAVACIAAAAGGGFLASRQNATPVPVMAAPTATEAPGAVPPATAPPSGVTTPEKPVQETEAVVGDSQKAPQTPGPTEPASSFPAPVKHTDAPGRAPARATKSASSAGAPRNASGPGSQAWPGGTPAGAQTAPSLPNAPGPPMRDDATTPPGSRPDDRSQAEPPRSQEPPAKMFQELVVPADSVVGLQTENTISSERARVEDRVDARVTRDVRIGDKVAIPAGTRVMGSVTQVERGGKFKERARLGVRFHTLVFADGTRVPISTDTIFRDGEAPTSAQKIGGGAVAGAILGAILGGAKGAAIGGTAGAGAGAAVTAAGDRSAATLPAGSPVTARFLSPITVTVEQK
jgi:hypothetical protein